MKYLPAVFLFCLIFLTSNVFSQKTVAPKFSSAYTNLTSDCKAIKGGEGTDDASDCKGVGGYRIYLSPSAAMLGISAQIPNKTDAIQIATQDIGFDETKRRIEWRLANGKPFAVIMRVAKYGETDEENPYFGKKIGEELVVVGLQGFEKIDFKVDANTPNANEKARELADGNYNKK